MYTGYTYNDWIAEVEDKRHVIHRIIDEYKSSSDFKTGLEASHYFQGNNVSIQNKTVLKADATYVSEGKDEDEDKKKRSRKRKKLITRDVVGNRISTDFFYRFVVQENEHLLANGVTLETSELKNKLGLGFDRTLEQMGEKALQHGVCWGYWNKDHLECIPAIDGALNGAVALVDELTSNPRVLIQFWQIATNRPLMARVFEEDGVTLYRADEEGVLQAVGDKRAYIEKVTSDGLGEITRIGSNYTMLPVVPLYANVERRSEFTNNIKSKIDMYDFILSDFGDNLERANDVYWVLNNFGGTIDDVAEMVQQMERMKVVSNFSDGTGAASSAEPKTIEVPYNARSTALDLLKKALYQDYMALDMQELTGGSYTNVAIRAAMINLNLKVDRYEWQCFNFVQNILKVIGIETERISFVRQNIVNDTEVISNIYMMREDIDRETALKLNPYIAQEDIKQIMADLDAEDIAGMDSMDELDDAIDDNTIHSVDARRAEAKREREEKRERRLRSRGR